MNLKNDCSSWNEYVKPDISILPVSRYQLLHLGHMGTQYWKCCFSGFLRNLLLPSLNFLSKDGLI